MIVGWPLTTRDEIVAAYKLGADVASDTPFKTLRRQGIVSPGIRVVLRRQGRVSGQRVFYSAMCLHAARLARRGFLTDARQLASASRDLEDSPDARLVAEGSAGEETPQELVEQLATKTAEILRAFDSVLGGFSEEVAGRVVAIDDVTVVVMSKDGEWCFLRGTLPSTLAVHGSPVVVTTEWLGAAGALVTTRPGVCVGTDTSPSIRTPQAVRPLLPVPFQTVQHLRSAINDALGSMVAEGLRPSADVLVEAEKVASGEVDIDDFVVSVLNRYGALR